MKSLTIPDGITRIGKFAFVWCDRLESVTLPASMKTLDVRAFSGCERLKSITIPAGVTALGNSAFNMCYSLRSVFFQRLPPKDNGAFNYNEKCYGCYPDKYETEWKKVIGQYSGLWNQLKMRPRSSYGKPPSYSLVFKPDGRTDSMAKVNYEIGESYTLPANAFARGGYRFAR